MREQKTALIHKLFTMSFGVCAALLATSAARATPSSALLCQKLFAESESPKALYSVVSQELPLSELEDDSQKLAEKMKANFGIKFFEETNERKFGSWSEADSAMSLRLGYSDQASVLIHEITHATSNRNLLKATSISAFAAAAGRAIGIRDHGQTLSGYENFFRTDEVEARLKEAAYLRYTGKPSLPTEQTAKRLAEVQLTEIRRLLKAGRNSWYVYGSPKTKSISANRKTVQTVTIPVPTGSAFGQELKSEALLKYLEDVLVKREARLLQLLDQL